MVFLSVACFLSLPLAHAQGTLKPPTALTVASATRSAVALSWTAGDASSRFVVERKPLGAAWPAPPPAKPPASAVITMTVDGAKATDSQIDAFATYVYRVRATDAANALSAPSNEVTVGPPPVGFSSIVDAPKAMQDHDPQQFAGQIRMMLDANGDPAFAYITYDLNNDGEADDSELSFIAWDRATYRWKAPVQVDGTAGALNRRERDKER